MDELDEFAEVEDEALPDYDYDTAPAPAGRAVRFGAQLIKSEAEAPSADWPASPAAALVSSTIVAPEDANAEDRTTTAESAVLVKAPSSPVADEVDMAAPAALAPAAGIEPVAPNIAATPIPAPAQAGPAAFTSASLECRLASPRQRPSSASPRQAARRAIAVPATCAPFTARELMRAREGPRHWEAPPYADQLRTTPTAARTGQIYSGRAPPSAAAPSRAVRRPASAMAAAPRWRTRWGEEPGDALWWHQRGQMPSSRPFNARTTNWEAHQKSDVGAWGWNLAPRGGKAR